MASKYAELGMLCFVITATMLAAAEANMNFTSGLPWNHRNVPQNSRKMVVGGDEKWHFGFNYANWAVKNGPFYVNDTLVFKFDAPSNSTIAHSVYLVPNYWSYLICDLSRAKKLAGIRQGKGEGFKFMLAKWKPYYFACGQRNGYHCKFGQMKFAVMPRLHWRY